MKLLHKKSECCGAKLIRFGGKRRQCVACKKTWRVHQSKRGRKPLRQQKRYLVKIFNHGFSVKQLALNSALSEDAVYKRFSKNLDRLIKKKRIVRIRGSKLILLIDAQWQYFKGNLWTMYFLSAKSINSTKVTIFDPILRKGRESFSDWNFAINQLPSKVKKRVIAVVSDGIRGIETISTNNGWLLQRCHFHLLGMLQKMRGKRLSTSGRLIREEIYQSVKLSLSETSERKLNTLLNRLSILAEDDLCPVRMRGAVRDFLRKYAEFRTYLEYPNLKIPTTVNVMESNNSYTRRKSKTVNNPNSWHKWAIACARFKSKFICK